MCFWKSEIKIYLTFRMILSFSNTRSSLRILLKTSNIPHMHVELGPSCSLSSKMKYLCTEHGRGLYSQAFHDLATSSFSTFIMSHSSTVTLTCSHQEPPDIPQICYFLSNLCVLVGTVPFPWLILCLFSTW